MEDYRLHEADISIPDKWKDNSMNTFVLAPEQPGKANGANFVITRDSNSNCETVQDYADQQLVEAAKALKGFKLDWRREGQIGEQPAIEVSYQWTTPDRLKVQQRQLYVKHMERFIIFTFTTKLDVFSKHEQAWQDIIATIVLRND